MSGAALFGKLPAHGDFVSRGLPAAERERIDGWLSDSLARAQSALGNDFTEAFDRAPPWRCAAAGVGGAIAASQDSAGRRYPILLMVGDPDAAATCEELLYAAIGERWDADRLAREAGGAPAGDPDRWWSGEATAAAVSLDGAFPTDLLTAMLREPVTP